MRVHERGIDDRASAARRAVRHGRAGARVTRSLRFAVIGDPIGHSKSPRMHGAAYAALGLPHTYEALATRPDEVAARVRAVRDGAYAGMNVTVPHKRAVLDHVDLVDASARAVLAANTLVRDRDGRVVAFNTDVPALAAELARLAPERDAAAWGARPALILGSGGAARAAVAAVASLGVRSIHVRARSVEGARALRAIVSGAEPPIDVVAAPIAPGGGDALFATIVQATSAGMSGGADGEPIARAVPWGALAVSAVALDVVYAPPETPFLAAARARGLRADNGFGMLVSQGALAFEMWLGVRPPLDAMRAALG